MTILKNYYFIEISTYDFSDRLSYLQKIINIDDIILLSPAIKDQFFNYLDYYKNGLVDLETFLKRFKEFKLVIKKLREKRAYRNKWLSGENYVIK